MATASDNDVFPELTRHLLCAHASSTSVPIFKSSEQAQVVGAVFSPYSADEETDMQSE